MPVHQIAIVAMGIHLIDNMQLGRLLAALPRARPLGVPVRARAAASRTRHGLTAQPPRHFLSRVGGHRLTGTQ